MIKIVPRGITILNLSKSFKNNNRLVYVLNRGNRIENLRISLQLMIAIWSGEISKNEEMQKKNVRKNRVHLICWISLISFE